MDSSIGDIDSDPNWVDYLNPTQRQVLEDLKKQQQEFDVHYDEWQKELQTWRAANANHSDPKSYQDYARRWEEWKNKLLSQKNQMERLYKQTLIQLKTQAAKQKEQMNMNMNQHRPMIRQQFTPTSNSQPNFQSHPPMYSQQPYFNQQIAMNSPYFPQQRPFGAIPYQQPRYNQIPQNPMSLPPHLYPGPMPGIMMPPIVQAQANAPVSVFPPLSQQSPAQALPLAGQPNISPWGVAASLPATVVYPHLLTAPPPPPPPPPSSSKSSDPEDSNKSKTGTKASGTSRIDDIVKRASQLIPGLGQYLDEDSSDETLESKKITVDLTGDEESTHSREVRDKQNQSSNKSASSIRNNENNNSKQDSMAKNNNSNSVISSEKTSKTTNDTRHSNKSSLEYASRERSNQRNDALLKDVRSNLMSDSDSEEDVHIEHITDDKQNKPFDLAGVINQMKSIKPANNNNQTSHSSDHDDRNQGQALHQTQQSSHNQQPNPFQFRGRISTEGLTTIIEPVDDKPKQQTSPEANQRHDPNRRRSDGFHHMEGSNISRPRQPYVAKTIDYDHGSPSIGPSLPPPRGPDSPRGINRAPLRSAIPRGPPPRFGPRPFINNRGPPPQIPPFNRVPLTPPNAPHQGPVFGPHPPPRPTFGARPYFNERPRFGPSFPAGPSQGIPRGPALPPRPNFNQMPPSSNSSSQPPHQRSEIPVKQLTYKDEEYFTAPPSRMVSLEELLVPPTRDFRPKSIVIILRGLPGSGKTHLAKLIRDKETENGGSAPRILSIDDYFMVEKEVMVTDENGKKVKSKEFVYEYEEAMEVSYRASLLKAFKKTTDAPYFKFIIVDAVNSWVSHFHEFHAHAASKGFTVYICEIDCKDPEFCSKRNVHNRTLEEIRKLARIWEKTPRDFIQLDTTTFMQNILTEEADNNSSESNSKDKRRLEETEEDDIISKKLASGVNPSRDEVESKAEVMSVI
uniref:YLP motif-containing protein 1 n=1 Tax=Tetranychus urticae TaxID=32264 RepID=T1JXU4_TETUR